MDHKQLPFREKPFSRQQTTKKDILKFPQLNPTSTYSPPRMNPLEMMKIINRRSPKEKNGGAAKQGVEHPRERSALNITFFYFVASRV